MALSSEVKALRKEAREALLYLATVDDPQVTHQDRLGALHTLLNDIAVEDNS